MSDEAEDDHKRDDAQGVGSGDNVELLEHAHQAEEAQGLEHAEDTCRDGIARDGAGVLEDQEGDLEGEEREHVDPKPAARIVT